MKRLNTVISMGRIAFILLLVAGFMGFSSDAMAKVKSRKVTINTEPGSIIYIDGKQAESNPAEVKVEANTNVIVKVMRKGFITMEKNYQNDGEHEIPREEFYKLEVDEAFNNSVETDQANRDVNIKTGMKEDDAWKMIGHIVTSSFDVIDVSDKATGYIRTGWVVNNYKAATVRSRVIIKIGSSSPLVYRAKVVSEIAKPGTPVGQDEAFKPWDRVLRSYENITSDLQTRLMK